MVGGVPFPGCLVGRIRGPLGAVELVPNPEIAEDDTHRDGSPHEPEPVPVHRSENAHEHSVEKCWRPIAAVLRRADPRAIRGRGQKGDGT
jgi:hypothetical protein